MELPSKQAIVAQFEAVAGRHDELEIYGGDPGDPGLTGPGSMSWEIHSDIGAIAAAGMGAIIMEILHPSVMAGVHDQSSYRTQPERRARNTFGYVIVTTFGNTTAAEKMINRVRRMHETVNGTRPDGTEYRAMDPDLIGWVHNAIPWAIMEAFDRYSRPLSVQEKNRYLAEQAVIGRLGGAGFVPETVDELQDYVEAMRPKLAVTQQTMEFIDFLGGQTGGPDSATGLDRLNRRGSLHASMSLMPEWAQRMTGLHHPDLAQRYYFDPTTKLTAKLLRWAFETPTFRQLAEARATGAPRDANVRAA
jgi:uncharacterized protein (DUF2236 family)